jgi:hypothetical protein
MTIDLRPGDRIRVTGMSYPFAIAAVVVGGVVAYPAGHRKPVTLSFVPADCIAGVEPRPLEDSATTPRPGGGAA